ncbi:MAG TPA: GNAT family N-acetyltransferase [Dysgonomonas sp.]|nr:GNAT family N-acetyltransferase [Dysgonomonas sp.]
MLQIWESAVKATHHFLSEEDFEFYKSRMPLYFYHIDIYTYLDDNKNIKGFLGVSKDMIEMLFVENESRGLGIGKNLLIFAIRELELDRVDVNLQNEQALHFYKHFGFKEKGVSEKDSEGKDYPIVHLQLFKQ